MIGQALPTWWRSKPPREQRLIGALLLSAIVIVAWLAVWEPLVRQVTSGTVRRAHAERELAQARIDVEDTARLARAPLPPPVDARRQLEESLHRASLRAAVAQLDWQADGRARITFATVEFPRLVAWLETVHHEVGLTVQEATLSGLVQPGLVRAELTLGH